LITIPSPPLEGGGGVGFLSIKAAAD